MRRGIRKHALDFAAIVGLFLAAGGIAAYILNEQRLRFPLVEAQPFRLKLELEDAQSVTAGQGQSVQVAGVKVGDIGKVELEDGRAVVTLELLPEHDELVRADATALLRPRTPLKDMLVEIAPGRGRPLEEGERITLASSLPDIDLDEVLTALDADTRAYLKLLVTGAGEGLRGRGDDLRATFRALGPLHADLDRVAQAIARRRSSVRRLVSRYGLLADALGRSESDLTRLVRASDATFGAFASRREELAAAVGALPGALRATEGALARVDVLGRRLPPALEALRPVVRELDPATGAALPLARAATPIIRDRLRPLARLAPTELGVIGGAAANLAQAGPDLTGAFLRLNRLLDILAFNPGGREGLEGLSFEQQQAREEGYLYWLAANFQAGTSAFGYADGQGVFRRFNSAGTSCGTLAAGFGVPPGVADLLGEAGLCTPVVRNEAGR